MKKHLLFLFAALLPLVASAEKVEIDGIWYNLVSKAKQAEVTFKGDSYDSYYDEYSGSITIPATVTHNGVAYSVTSIGSHAFWDCRSLTAITIPASVTSIGAEAFEGCRSLTAITLPEGVTSIGESAFASCSSLTAINIPEGVTSIRNGAFDGCSSLTAITLPEGVTSIGSYAFFRCSSLSAITLPEGVTSIRSFAFYGCSSLTSITLPEGVTSTSIGERAFADCSSLTTIVLPKNVKWIYSEAFAGCPELTDVYYHAEKVPSTESDAFNGSYIEYATLHVPASAINSYKATAPWSSFGTIVSLTEEKVTSITLSQTEATLTEGQTLTLIATVTPEDATDKRIVWSSSNPSVATVDNMGKVTAIASGTATITATANDDSGVSAQCEVTVASTAKVEIDGIWYNLTSETKQAEVTFKGNSYYEYINEYSGSITIPTTVTYEGVDYSVTSIGNYAFYDCSSLTAITIPESVTSIGEWVFRDCSLTTITIPESVTSIGDAAFGGCNSLTAITVAEGNTRYDSRGGCNAIIETNSNTLIAGCSTTIIPEGVTSIGLGAFYDCDNLTAITIPESVTSIGKGAFAYCSNLTAITIPESVTSIGWYAFEYCSSLTAITIPEGVTSIGDRAFWDCPSLTAITIPEGVTSIGSEAFWGCTSLTAITCEAKTPLTLKNSYVFSGVNKSIPLYVPAGSVAAYKAAQYWNEFTNIQAIVNNVVLLDSQASLTQGEDEVCASISYTRNFKNTNWQALYVPFEIPITEAFLAEFEVAYIYDARQYDRNDDGIKDETIIESFKKKSGVLEANYPYLIRAKEVEEKTITVTDAILYATEENSYDCSSMFDTYTFTGTYSRIPAAQLPQNEGYYALSGGVWQPIASGSSLGAFRFYMQIESRNGGSAPAQTIRMRVIDEDDATEIDNTEFTDGNSQLIIYDLQGRRITDTTNLKGVYIVNGKKVIF